MKKTLAKIRIRDEFNCDCGTPMRVYGIQEKQEEILTWKTIHKCGLPEGYSGPPESKPFGRRLP